MTGPRVLALLGDRDGCAWWRILRPYERLAEAGLPIAWGFKDDPRFGTMQGMARVSLLFDAVVLPRLSWEDHRAGGEFIDRLHAADLCVIFECDDDLFSPTINARLKQTVQIDKTPEQLERGRLDRLAALRMCDGVTVSSRRLQSVMRSLVDVPVVCVSNAIDTRWWRHALRGRKRLLPGTVVGWAGGARPGEDLAIVAEAWVRIARRRPDVHFALIGWQAHEFEAIPKERLHRIPWQQIDAYPQALAQFDIACCSVADNAFNRSKTPIKVWEATMAGAAVVATPNLYAPVIADGEDGLLAETADEWEAAIEHLIEHPDERRRLRRNQRRRIAAEHSLDKQLWRWPAAYASIIEDWRARQRRRSILLPGTMERHAFGAKVIA